MRSTCEHAHLAPMTSATRALVLVALVFAGSGCSAAASADLCRTGDCDDAEHGDDAGAKPGDGDAGDDDAADDDGGNDDAPSTTDATDDDLVRPDVDGEDGAGEAGEDGPPPCGTPEGCNGLDDDCDGVVDEGPSPECIDACCDDEIRCRLGRCVRDLGACVTNDDCWSDSYCLDGVCIPYQHPLDHDRDDSCVREVVIDALVPALQCAWTDPGPDGLSPSWYQVMATPTVVDFDLDDDPSTLAPSIVFPTFDTGLGYGGPGVLRVIDGRTCETQFSLGGEDAVTPPAPIALADLDGDGRAEMIASAHGGGVIAFGWDPGTRTFGRLWRSGTCADDGSRSFDTTGPSQWSGPSVHDLDDGQPEVLNGAVVYDSDGCIRSVGGFYPSFSVGVVPVVADVDEDRVPEIVFGNGVYQWNPVTGALDLEPWFTGTGNGHGQVAVADLGVFPIDALGGFDGAEIVVIASGVRVQTLDGTVVFSAPIPGGGGGGPPTIADFDGDGRAEFATAGGNAYVVYDMDCVEGGDPAGCAGEARTDGILWSQPSQDHSSSVTGSSVFDFNADGAAEAVYADECYLRVYEGATGRVVYSAARSSGTTYENPVIVDADGDFHTEIVSSVNDYAGTLGCADPDLLYPDTAFSTGHGIIVLRDELDRWAASRPVWNQHAYAVTHVGDRGETPAAGDVAVNWRTPGLNNFRQNVQGELESLGIPDLTAAELGGARELECEPEGFGHLEARVCNRGMLPLGPGMVVAFADGSETGPELCRATLDTALPIGGCALVGCVAELAGFVVDVFVVIDPDNAVEECWEGNNFAFFGEVRCKA